LQGDIIENEQLTGDSEFNFTDDEVEGIGLILHTPSHCQVNSSLQRTY